MRVFCESGVVKRPADGGGGLHALCNIRLMADFNRLIFNFQLCARISAALVGGHAAPDAELRRLRGDEDAE